MDWYRLREDFEGLSPEDQMAFMLGVGPGFCRTVLADPARRRAMLALCLREHCRPAAAVLRRVRAARATLRAVGAGVRAGFARLRQAPAA